MADDLPYLELFKILLDVDMLTAQPENFSQRNLIKRWLFILQGVNMGKGYSLIRISEIETHIESKVKRTGKTRCSLVKYFFNTQREILYLHTAM